MLINKGKVLSGFSIGFISLFFFIFIDILYEGQGYSAYFFLPVQIIVLVSLIFIGSKTNFLSLNFFLLLVISIVFYLFFRGSSFNRTPLKDLNILLNKESIKFEDIVNDNSLIRKLAIKKFNIKDEYFYFSYSRFKENYEIETIVFLDKKNNYIILDTNNLIFFNQCLHIKNGSNENYCFSNSILDIAFMNDSCSIIVLKSNEISQSISIDDYLVYW